MEKNIGIAVFCVLFLVWQVNASTVNCTETGAGRYADSDDTTCRNYTYCVYVSSSDSYVSYDYECTSGAVFNPDTAKCTDASNYVCNGTSNSTNSSSVCTEDGYVADPDSTNCTTYIECVDNNGTYSETTYTCPDDTYYDPNTTYCESDYNCTTSSNDTSTFTCTSTGRFANSDDDTCKSYYLCVEASNGTYYAYEYNCTSTAVFNPSSKVCTTSYTCGS